MGVAAAVVALASVGHAFAFVVPGHQYVAAASFSRGRQHRAPLLSASRGAPARGGGRAGRVPSMSAPDLEEPAMLIGHGFDIHRLVEGKELVIGGVNIPYELGADAHSDGDVIYHSVVDAILGALGLPDIGQLFPDNDPDWSGADSSIFMEEAYRRMDERGFRVGNVDVTLILQKPKVMDIKPLMRDNIVRLLRTSLGRVNVKARTHEKVDSVGEGRAMACHVVVLLEKVP
ncbi:unnamed protein product [Ectocarpus sp. CCAP 1310/34]|nr:unnamed protein product [Ectocarpus sp. CCAP 1310/34]